MRVIVSVGVSHITYDSIYLLIAPRLTPATRAVAAGVVGDKSRNLCWIIATCHKDNSATPQSCVLPRSPFLLSFFSDLLDMNALPDSHRRTSISQLLNPLSNLPDQPPFALPQNSSLSGAVGPAQLQQDQQPGQPPFPGATFNLRAASWDHVQEDNNPNKRKPENGTSPSRVYHSSPMNPTDGFGDHGTRATRSRVDEGGNYVENGMLYPSHEIASIPYGTTAIAPMYSDERTGMGSTFASHLRFCSLSMPQLYRAITPRTVGPILVILQIFGSLNT
jgi:hypothetical protein